MRLFFVLSALIVISFSCARFNKRQQEPVARVYNNYLYKEDLAGIFPRNITPADSLRIARNYTDKWIRNQLFLRLAELNLPEEEKNLDKQIADFRASLLIHKYQEQLLSQKLDSIISLQELEDYYEEHGNNFILEKPAVLGIYLKLPVNAPNQSRLLTWFRSDDNFLQIENHARQYAVNYAWFNENWVYLDDILNELPQGSYNLPSNLLNTGYISATDQQYYYFIGISDYKPSRSQMPFSLASDKIRNIILNKRKIQFLNELEKNVFTEGLTKNAFQYY